MAKTRKKSTGDSPRSLSEKPRRDTADETGRANIEESGRAPAEESRPAPIEESRRTDADEPRRADTQWAELPQDSDTPESSAPAGTPAVQAAPVGAAFEGPATQDAEMAAGSDTGELWAPQATGDTTAAGGERERIAARAYELYLARGGRGGDAMDDWLTAEREFSSRNDDKRRSRE